MNKDTRLASFKLTHEMATEGAEFVEIYSQLPAWITNIYLFLVDRRAPKHREHIAKLLSIYDCNSLEGYLRVTHALSLNDTLWVKSDSDFDLRWDNVSLYRNPFNVVIANTAFDGGINNITLSSTSPEFSTDGSFAKCWVRENGIVKLLKRGSEGFSNTGLEPYSEYYASYLLDCFGVNHVSYDIMLRNKKVCTSCNLFTSEKYGFIPFSRRNKHITGLPDLVKTYTEWGYSQFISDMLVIDAIIMNEDRHMNNFGFMIDNDTFEILGPAPLFDHNISLLCYATMTSLKDPYSYMSAKGHKLDSGCGNFIDLPKYIMTNETRNKLLNIRGITLKESNTVNLSKERLNILSKVINNQIEQLLR
jgi:hypothetical protein